MLAIIIVVSLILYLCYVVSAKLNLGGKRADSYVPQPLESFAIELPDLSSLTLVNTIDGFIHGLDATSKQRWKFDTGGPLAAAHHCVEDRPYWLIPEASGDILVHSRDGMAKSSVSTKMLVERAPFKSEKDGLYFTGHKNSRVLAIDVRDGSLVHDSAQAGDKNRLRPNPSSRKYLFWLGRTDYVLRAFEIATGRESFNLSYSEVNPLPSMQAALEDSSDDADVDVDVGVGVPGRRGRLLLSSSLSRLPASPLPLLATAEGDLYHGDQLAGQYRRVPLGSTAVAAFTQEPHLEDGTPGWVQSSVHPIRLPRHAVAFAATGSELAVGYSSDAKQPEYTVRATANGRLFALHVEDLPDDPSLRAAVGRAQFVLQSDKRQPDSSMLSLPSACDADDERGCGSDDTGSDEEASALIRRQISAERVDSRHHRYRRIIQNGINMRRNVLNFSSRVNAARRHGRADSIDKRHVNEPKDRGTMSVGRLCSDQSDAASLLPSCEAPSTQRESLYEPAADTSPVNQDHEALPNFLDWRNYQPPARRRPVIDASPASFDSSFRIDQFQSQLGVLEWTLLRLLLLIVSLALAIFFVGVLLKRFQSESASLVPTSEPQNAGNAIPAAAASAQDASPASISHSEEVLGRGSHGTVVFRGTLHGRPVAVKRMLAHYNKLAEREISLLVKSDGHPNVVRYFLREERGDFVYLALQLCEMSLRDFVVKVQQQALAEVGEDVSAGRPVISDVVRKALCQIALGVAHLHGQSIVHRDIKPHNILCAYPDTTRTARGGLSLSEVTSLSQLELFELKISDMGLSKQLAGDDDSFASLSLSAPSRATSAVGYGTKSDVVGTVGWQAPELIALRESMPVTCEADSDGSGRVRRTQFVDVFSLGCVFYFILVPGVHPFGKWYEREANIMTDKVDLRGLQHSMEASHLVTRMLQRDPLARPTSCQVALHPFLWPTVQRLEFMMDLSDRLEQEAAESPLMLALEGAAWSVVGRGWERRLDSGLLEDVGKYRKYDTTSVRDLLRLVRNKRHHYLDLTETVKATVGTLPVGFTHYFEAKFPSLLLHCVRVACHYLCEDATLGPKVAEIRSMFVTDEASSQADEAEASPLDGTHCSLADGLAASTSPLDVIVWHKSATASSFNCHGWWREADAWQAPTKKRSAHLDLAAADPRYRSRLCSHWEASQGTHCPMRKRGKCDFAHGVLELRTGNNRRDKWGRQQNSTLSQKASGGVDCIALARNADKVRSSEAK